MRFLLDANIPRVVAHVITSHGHLVEHVIDSSLNCATDDIIAKHAVRDAAVLITRDMDFADLRRYPTATTPGVVVLRVPDDMTAEDIAKVVENFLRALGDATVLTGRLAIVEGNRYRLRPPLA